MVNLQQEIKKDFELAFGEIRKDQEEPLAQDQNEGFPKAPKVRIGGRKT